jgi:hypothetical protein
VLLLWYLLSRNSSFDLPDLLDTPEDPRHLWLSAAGFFRRHKLVPFGSPAYQSAADPPRVPAHRSFLPRETEDFVHRLWRLDTSAKLTSWSGPVRIQRLTLDQSCPMLVEFSSLVGARQIRAECLYKTMPSRR